MIRVAKWLISDTDATCHRRHMWYIKFIISYNAFDNLEETGEYGESICICTS
jgi:hypothetical protein